MQESGVVDRRERSTEIDPNGDDLIDRQRAAFGEDRFQGAAVDELSPDAHLIAEILRTVNREHVGMAHACEQTRFLNRAGRRGERRRGGVQKLQRDTALQPCVPREKDLAEATAPTLERIESAPQLASVPCSPSADHLSGARCNVATSAMARS